MAVRFDRFMVRWPLAAAALAVLLVLDVADVGLYIGYSLAHRDHFGGWISDRVFDMNHEFGLGEWVEYTKSIVAAGAALICGRRSGQPIFYALSGLNLWLAGDNAFRIHERAGSLIGDFALAGDSHGFLRPDDAGEFIYLVAFGIVVLLLLGWALRRTEKRVLPTGLLLAAAAMSPGLTGVFVDAFHALRAAHNLSVASLVVVEDGGETVMLSVSCALTLGCLAHLSGRRVARKLPVAQQA